MPEDEGPVVRFDLDLDELRKAVDRGGADEVDHEQVFALHMHDRAKAGGFDGTRAVDITADKITVTDLILAAYFLREWETGLPPMDEPEEGETLPTTDDQYIAAQVEMWGTEAAAEAAQEIETYRAQARAAREMVEAELARRGPYVAPDDIKAVAVPALAHSGRTARQRGVALDAVVRRDEIWIDPAVLRLADRSDEEIAEWTRWATAVLDRGCATGEWPEGPPITSDRAGTRGPHGERYVLLGFSNDPDTEDTPGPG
jgi:hypothetical protein